jgi:hypothetical protein
VKGRRYASVIAAEDVFDLWENHSRNCEDLDAEVIAHTFGAKSNKRCRPIAMAFLSFGCVDGLALR